jgi:hypothetical protein
MLTVKEQADEVDKFLDFLSKDEYAYDRKPKGDCVVFDVFKQGTFFGSWIVGPGDKCGPTQGSSRGWTNVVYAIWSHLAMIFGDNWKGPRPDMKAIQAAQEAADEHRAKHPPAPGHVPLGTAPLDPDQRNWEFEMRLIGLWEPGTNFFFPFPIDLLARELLACPSQLVKITQTMREDGVRRYRLEYGGEAAELILRTAGDECIMILTPLGQCRLETPAGDAIHNVISGAIFWAEVAADWQGAKFVTTPINPLQTEPVQPGAAAGLASNGKAKPERAPRRDARQRYALLEVIRRKQNYTESQVTKLYWGRASLFGKFEKEPEAQAMVSYFSTMDEKNFWTEVQKEKQKANQRKKKR